ncbi:hypothetical protein LCGC14_2936000, partial [marine sediment metagenome]
LANLERVSVSPEFDFRMKSSLRHEYEYLRNPFYVAKIFFTENMFNPEKVSFEIHINKETGELDDFKRLDE